jgi:hypothetical protein
MQSVCFHPSPVDNTNLAEALGLAREAGFEAVTLFEKREPRRLRIT